MSKLMRNHSKLLVFKRFYAKKRPKKCMIGEADQFKLVLVRHGESEWNEKNLFCGWYDSFLTPNGLRESENAGMLLRRSGFLFDIAYTSMLTRAQQTLQAILMRNDRPNVKTVQSWRLNERHYGALTGMNKQKAAEKYGDDKVQLWRRGFDVRPPPMEKNHPYHDDIRYDVRYDAGPKASEFPKCESLKMTIARTLPIWHNMIVPNIKMNRKVLIVAHGNSIRGLIKVIEDLDGREISKVDIPTAVPMIYVLNTFMRPVKPRKFLGDASEVRQAIEKVKSQGKKKKSGGNE